MIPYPSSLDLSIGGAITLLFSCDCYFCCDEPIPPRHIADTPCWSNFHCFMVVFTRRGASLIESSVSRDGTLDRSAVLRVDVSTDLRVNDMKWLAVLYIYW